MQSSKYFAQILFIMIGTTSKGGTVKLVTFIFFPLAKGHPNNNNNNIYKYIYIYIYLFIYLGCLYRQITEPHNKLCCYSCMFKWAQLLHV